MATAIEKQHPELLELVDQVTGEVLKHSPHFKMVNETAQALYKLYLPSIYEGVLKKEYKPHNGLVDLSPKRVLETLNEVADKWDRNPLRLDRKEESRPLLSALYRNLRSDAHVDKQTSRRVVKGYIIDGLSMFQMKTYTWEEYQAQKKRYRKYSSLTDISVNTRRGTTGRTPN